MGQLLALGVAPSRCCRPRSPRSLHTFAQGGARVATCGGGSPVGTIPVRSRPGGVPLRSKNGRPMVSQGPRYRAGV
jgi:hypothetical protein